MSLCRQAEVDPIGAGVRVADAFKDPPDDTSGFRFLNEMATSNRLCGPQREPQSVNHCKKIEEVRGVRSQAPDYCRGNGGRYTGAWDLTPRTRAPVVQLTSAGPPRAVLMEPFGDPAKVGRVSTPAGLQPRPCKPGILIGVSDETCRPVSRQPCATHRGFPYTPVRWHTRPASGCRSRWGAGGESSTYARTCYADALP